MRKKLLKPTDRLPLGGSGLFVSPICLGLTQHAETVLVAFDAGINFFFVPAISIGLATSSFAAAWSSFSRVGHQFATRSSLAWFLIDGVLCSPANPAQLREVVAALDEPPLTPEEQDYMVSLSEKGAPQILSKGAG